MSTSDCGCGCGGESAFPAAFVRPRFFAGQLLTEDDLTLLTDYVAGKDRLHNRTLFGPGVVCGLEVLCDSCPGGTVSVRPGHALDCCGNDIVLSCKEKVDVAALVRELRVTSPGVHCGDPCDDDQRHFGLFVRYEEIMADPVAPYATEEPCPTPGCAPSRVQEGFRFVVKCDTTDDHRYNPATKLLARIGGKEAYEQILLLSRRLARYLDPMSVAGRFSTRTLKFDEADAVRYTDNLRLLQESGEGVPKPPEARQQTEYVRALASAIARYDTYDEAGQKELQEKFKLKEIDAARKVLGTACDRLAGTKPEEVWPEPAHRQVALAVVAEAKNRVATPDPNAPIEVRLVAQSAPLDNVLEARFRADLVRIRDWLLGRLDRVHGVADCLLHDDVRKVAIPQPLPIPQPDPAKHLSVADLGLLTTAAGQLTTCVQRFVTDAACSTLNPPCVECADNDVLLAHLELDGCDVVRVCSATREQVLPGGSAYGEWLPKLYQLRHLAEQVCCQPTPVYKPPDVPASGPIPRPYVPGLLEEWGGRSPLDRMWNLLVTPAPGETVPKPVREQVYTVPAEVTDSLQEMNALRAQVSDLIATVESLRGKLDTASEQVSQVRDELPERLSDRLSELESAPEPETEEKPPAKRTRSTSSRSSSTRKPRSGESS
ncbi:coiled-coil domain-containing protein [Amycolatopsis azurea]|uniref:Uncharacterized protein n=1 Tax=Amycolatopsis azurea DSM 43854 TaxID=1238180 RepID=M2Q178_9PSEU|nr:hypothetical protein [Amycolatopsis azurea]EMD25710.1 hypothetical protein C791_4605 [Amycolatopsis azurea DSM 43854]OOC02592.1 hypothetical protein B0293_31020 [Amycolatopsis azurea DSM 43854]